jgi:hypothetical protein
MVNAFGGHKNPVGASVYGSIAGDAWYRAQYLLQDQKLGHYMHVPPKTVFFSQLFGSFIGVPINYAVIRWVIDRKGDYLIQNTSDPTHQWTGQSLTSSLTVATQYVLIVRQYPLNYDGADKCRDLNDYSLKTFTDHYHMGFFLEHLPLPCSTCFTVDFPERNSTCGIVQYSFALCQPFGGILARDICLESLVASSSCIGLIGIIMNCGHGIITFLPQLSILGLISVR